MKQTDILLLHIRVSVEDPVSSGKQYQRAAAHSALCPPVGLRTVVLFIWVNYVFCSSYVSFPLAETECC